MTPSNNEYHYDDVMNIIRTLLKNQMETKDLIVKIERRQRWARNINIFYIILLIGGVLGIYSFTRPYIDNIIHMFQVFQPSFSPLRSTGENIIKQ